MTGPAVVMAFAKKNGLSARNVFSNDFPRRLEQFFFPFFFSYGWAFAFAVDETKMRLRVGGAQNPASENP